MIIFTTYFEAIYDLLVSYKEFPRVHRSSNLFFNRLYLAPSNSTNNIFSKEDIINCMIENCYHKNAQIVVCDTILLRIDSNGYNYVYPQNKRRLKKVPIQEINNKLQFLREKYINLKAFW